MTALCEQEVARRAASLENHGFRRAGIDVLEAALAADPIAGSLWRLCVTQGDAPRAAVFGAHLAHLTAAAKARGAAQEETA